MNCETFLEQYFLCDKHQAIPAGAKIHLLGCKTCRAVIAKLSAADALQCRILNAPFDSGDRLLNGTMNAIYRFNKQNTAVHSRQDAPHSLYSWLAVGVFLIAGFTLLPFSSIGRTGLQQFGDSFCIPFALLCAGSIVAYCSVFLAKNLVFFADKFDVRQSG